MIACRSLFRTERTWHLQLANTIVSSTRLECYSHHGLMTYRKQRSAEYYSSSMDWNKKRKSVKLVWRPVSSSNAEFSANVQITESTNLVNQDASSARAVSEPKFRSTILEDKVEVSEFEGALSEAACNSSALLDNYQIKAAEKASCSAAKQSISIEVGASLMRFIKGKGGATQKSIEEMMGVKIIFPPSRKEDSITIEGNSVESITKASDKIQTIISEVVQSPKLDYSHFISLPLAVHPELVEKLFRFQSSILGEENIEEDADSGSDEKASEDETKSQLSEKVPAVKVMLNHEDDSNHVKLDIKSKPLISYQPKSSRTKTLLDLGIDKSIFIKPKTFHLTVLMLKLWKKEQVHAAKEVLQSISTKVIDALDGRPLSIRLKGLDCMRGSLAKARVLYAPVEEIGNEDRLVRACQVITDSYIEAGLVLEKDAGQKLKLHATVMNARHRKSKTRNKKFDSFDARGIFDKYGSEEWGEYYIREAHLSQRFVFDDSGYYHSCASIPFP